MTLPTIPHGQLRSKSQSALSFLALLFLANLAAITNISAEPPIHGVTVGEPAVVNDSQGDTWSLAWMPDGCIYSPSNDTNGFRNAGTGNIMVNEIFDDRPDSLEGVTVNKMTDYGKASEIGADGCTWKSSGCISVDGALYLVVARHHYGDNSGDPTKRQIARNASLIKSLDGGKTWNRSAKENYDHPMFPQRFTAPYFIHYGQDGHEAVADDSDRYVYALSNDGFWDNGDNLILGRVLRSKLPDLNAADWQFLRSGDGAQEANWTSKVNDAAPVLTNPNHLGSSGATYLPAQKCYFMIGWYYPAGGGKMPNAHTITIWDFYTAPHPWGPWTTIGAQTWSPQGYYCPGFCSKFNSPDGKTIWAFTAGDWTNHPFYKLTAIPLTLH